MVLPFVTALPAVAVAAIHGFVKSHPRVFGYVMATTLYEGARTLPRVRKAKWHAKSFYNGYTGPHVPLLTTEKIAASVFCSLQGLYAAPISLIEDIKRAEMKIRKLDPQMYGYTKAQIEGSDVYRSYLAIVMNSPEKVDGDRVTPVM